MMDDEEAICNHCSGTNCDQALCHNGTAVMSRHMMSVAEDNPDIMQLSGADRLRKIINTLSSDTEYMDNIRRLDLSESVGGQFNRVNTPDDNGADDDADDDADGMDVDNEPPIQNNNIAQDAIGDGPWLGGVVPGTQDVLVDLFEMEAGRTSFAGQRMLAGDVNDPLIEQVREGVENMPDGNASAADDVNNSHNAIEAARIVEHRGRRLNIGRATITQRIASVLHRVGHLGVTTLPNVSSTLSNIFTGNPDATVNALGLITQLGQSFRRALTLFWNENDGVNENDDMDDDEEEWGNDNQEMLEAQINALTDDDFEDSEGNNPGVVAGSGSAAAASASGPTNDGDDEDSEDDEDSDYEDEEGSDGGGGDTSGAGTRSDLRRAREAIDTDGDDESNTRAGRRRRCRTSNE